MCTWEYRWKTCVIVIIFIRFLGGTPPLRPRAAGTWEVIKRVMLGIFFAWENHVTNDCKTPYLLLHIFCCSTELQQLNEYKCQEITNWDKCYQSKTDPLLFLVFATRSRQDSLTRQINIVSIIINPIAWALSWKLRKSVSDVEVVGLAVDGKDSCG